MYSRSVIAISRQALLRFQLAATPRLSCARTLSLVPHSSSASQSSRTLNAQRQFSAAPINFSAGQIDADLVNKLEAEISYEKEAGSTEEPEWLKAFKADGTFEVKDELGSDEVVLTREFGNENIRVAFSCSDFEREEDDEELDLEQEDSEKEPNNSCRIRTAISITKSGKGGMVIDSTTDGTGFDVDNVSFYKDENLALDESSDNDWKRRGLYFGPTFVDLDEDLQHSFTEFLNERAIGPELAVIVLDLAEHKEQKEYVSWLNKMSKFIKA